MSAMEKVPDPGRAHNVTVVPQIFPLRKGHDLSQGRGRKGGRPGEGAGGLRRKYVKAVRIARNAVLGLHAETRDGIWVAGDFFWEG